MNPENKVGRVVAVCKSEKHGFPTYPQDSVAIGMLGIEGDAHSGPVRESFRQPGTFKENDRPISIVSEEIRLWVNDTLGLNMQHGDFNEQIVVEGLGDLGDVEIGSQITFGNGVRFEVVDRAYPCKKLEEHNGAGLIKALAEKQGDIVFSRRGILCKVLFPGKLQEDVTVVVEQLK